MNSSLPATSRSAASPLPLAEAARLQCLHSYGILDTPEEPDFDDITRIASEICGTPISLITLIDEDRAWFKSRRGLALTEAPREQAFCTLAIAQPAHILTIDDLAADPRTAANPFTAKPDNAGLAFYAGAVLSTTEGHKLGTLCVADYETRTLSDGQIAALESLAKQVMRQIELRRTLRILQETQRERDAAYKELEAFARLIAHDLKSPLANIVSFYDLLSLELDFATLGDEASQSLAIIGKSALRLTNMIDSVLEYSRCTTRTNEEIEAVDIAETIAEVLALLPMPAEATITTQVEVPVLRTHRTMLEQVLLNLLSNAARYIARPGATLRISARRGGCGSCILRIADNGPGMSPLRLDRAFELFNKGGEDGFQNADGTKRHGIGLATVKKLVTRLGGTVGVESEEGVGTTFILTLPDMG